MSYSAFPSDLGLVQSPRQPVTVAEDTQEQPHRTDCLYSRTLPPRGPFHLDPVLPPVLVAAKDQIRPLEPSDSVSVGSLHWILPCGQRRPRLMGVVYRPYVRKFSTVLQDVIVLIGTRGMH